MQVRDRRDQRTLRFDRAPSSARPHFACPRRERHSFNHRMSGRLPLCRIRHNGSAPLLRQQNPAHDERARSACRADERSTVKRSARWSGRTPSLLLLSSFGTRRSVAAFALHVQAAMTETQFSKQGEIRALMNDIRLK